MTSRVERASLAALLTAVILAAVAVLALLGGPTGGALVAWGEGVSGAVRERLQSVGAALPLGYAFAAGMLSALNPCGVGLLPAYLGLHLGGAGTPAGRRLAGAALFGVVVSATFVLVFTAGGALLGVSGGALVRWFPLTGLVVSVLLVAIGLHLLLGGTLPAGFGWGRAAARIGAAGAVPGVRGAAAYGLAFALTSLGCTLPIFLSVVGTSLVAPALLVGLAQFALYGLGLGAVLTALAVAAAIVGTGVATGVRQAGRYLGPAGALLLVVAGAYAAYYWLTIGGVLGQLAGAA